jgi:hypothetical protein
MGNVTNLQFTLQGQGLLILKANTLLSHDQRDAIKAQVASCLQSDAPIKTLLVDASIEVFWIPNN